MKETRPTLILEERLVPAVEFHAAPKAPNFQVRSDYSFRLDYLGENANCIAEMIHTTTAQEGEDVFKLSVTMRGFFRCEGIEGKEDKRTAHVMAYNILFPHMQAFIRGFTADVGLPPLTVAPMPPDPERISFEFQN